MLSVDWSMVYAGRSLDSLPFIDEVSHFGDRIEVRTDDVSGIPTAEELLGDCSDGTTVYACGPAPSCISSGSPRHRSSTAEGSRSRSPRPGRRSLWQPMKPC